MRVGNAHKLAYHGRTTLGEMNNESRPEAQWHVEELGAYNH